jgi:hypothetical protein
VLVVKLAVKLVASSKASFTTALCVRNCRSLVPDGAKRGGVCECAELS